MKNFFEGKSSQEISPSLPPGLVKFGEKWVRSQPIAIPGHRSMCYILGKFDTVVEFDDGSYGVIDFKTSQIKGSHIQLYTRQLHAYVYALENPAPGKPHLSPITKLGLLCVEPDDMSKNSGGRISYTGNVSWIECIRDDMRFQEFLGEVLYVLDRPDLPLASSNCGWCKYRENARESLL